MRGRVRVVEEAWKTMREQASRVKSKGKAGGGADIWALEEVANWVEDVLVGPWRINTSQRQWVVGTTSY